MREYVAFISYRHKPLDIAVAQRLHGLIEGYVIPGMLRKDGKKKFGIVFRDREELAASADLSQDIQEALDHSQYLIVVCTRDTPFSIWVEKEICYFLAHHHQQNVLIVLASGEYSEALPGVLTRPVIDVTGEEKRFEPLAVDVRAKSKWKCLSKLRRESKRLFAAMLHCPYDALVLREQRRRLVRFSALAAVVLTVAFGVIAMLWVKNRQIEQKNTELAWQKSQVQLRESELLMTNAQKALESEEYYSVVENATGALPHIGDEERPYYAPAEAILFETLGIFSGRKEAGIRKKTIAKQRTPISDFCTDGEGQWIITIDGYGWVRRFDANAEQEVWSVSLYEGSPLTNLLSVESSDHLFLSGDQCRVIGYHQGRLTCCDVKTGERLWSRDISSGACDYVFYNEDQGMVVYVDFVPGEQYTLELVCLSEKTGEPLQSLPFASVGSSWDCNFSEILEGTLSRGGTFSESGRYFAGAYREEMDDGSYRMNAFVADLQEGVAALCFQREAEERTGSLCFSDLQFHDQDESLLIVEEFVETSAVWVTKLNWKQKELVWQAQTPVGEEAEWDAFGTKAFAAYWKNKMLVARYTGLYCLSLETGEWLHSKRMPDTVIALKQFDGVNFGFALSDGTYGCGWLGAHATYISTEVLSGVYASIGTCDRVDICGGGIVQSVFEEGMMEISVSNVAVGGHLDVIPKKEKSSVVQICPVAVGQLAEQVPIQSPMKDTYWGRAVFHTCGEHAIVGGPFKVLESGEQVFLVIDTTSHEIKRINSIENEGIDRLSVAFLPDASGFILFSQLGSVFFMGARGGQTQLADEIDFDTERNSAWVSFTDGVRTGAAYLSKTGDVLTARCDRNGLTTWLNGTNEERIPLPSNQPSAEESGRYRCWGVQTGANGYVLLAFCGEDADPAVSDFAAYDTDGRQWKELIGTAIFPNESASALSESQPYWAVVDQEDTVRILDLSSGEEISSFPLALPCTSVEEMLFIMQDSCLLVGTKDGQVWVYDALSGVVLFREKVFDFGGELTVYADEENQRLYIAQIGEYIEQAGLCIDVRSWTKLASIPNLLYVDIGAQELYQAREGMIVVTKIPTTRELVALGEEWMGRQ